MIDYQRREGGWENPNPNPNPNSSPNPNKLFLKPARPGMH